MKLSKRKKIDFEINENGCFICTSHAKGKWGHCIMKRNGKHMGVYRFIYEQMFGEIEDDLIVRHKCDNGSCINPEHLELGTHQDNIDDKVKRRRSMKGEKHHNTKVKEEIAYFIKNDVEYTAEEISEKYGINVRQVMRIRSGERWGHIKTELPIEELQKLRRQRRNRNK